MKREAEEAWSRWVIFVQEPPFHRTMCDHGQKTQNIPQKLAALKATITAYATELELRGFTRRQIAMGMFGKALELWLMNWGLTRP